MMMLTDLAKTDAPNVSKDNIKHVGNLFFILPPVAGGTVYVSSDGKTWEKSGIDNAYANMTWADVGYNHTSEYILLPRDDNGNPTATYLHSTNGQDWVKSLIATEGYWCCLITMSSCEVAVTNILDSTTNTYTHAIYYKRTSDTSWKRNTNTFDGAVVGGIYNADSDFWILLKKDANSLTIEYSSDPSADFDTVEIKSGVDTTNSALVMGTGQILWYQTRSVDPYAIVDSMMFYEPSEWNFEEHDDSNFVAPIKVSMGYAFGSLIDCIGGKRSDGTYGRYIQVRSLDNEFIKNYSNKIDDYPVSFACSDTTMCLGTLQVMPSGSQLPLGITNYMYYAQYGDSTTFLDVHVSTDGGGTVKASATQVVEGMDITLSYKANSGYEFTGWQVVSPAGLQITNNTFTMPNSNVTIKGLFSHLLIGRLMHYQDIHSSNIDTWKSFREKYQSGDFAGAQTIAQNLTNTQMNAQALNDLFNFIVETEQLSDPTFKNDVIQVSTAAPAGLQVGQMYFKEYT